MKWVDLLNKNTDEITELLAEKRSELFSLRFQAAGSQLKQVNKIKDVRKLVAKLKILLQQRALETNNK